MEPVSYYSPVLQSHVVSSATNLWTYLKCTFALCVQTANFCLSRAIFGAHLRASQEHPDLQASDLH